MKKRLLATLLAASVAVALAACGRGGSSSGGGDSADGERDSSTSWVISPLHGVTITANA